MALPAEVAFGESGQPRSGMGVDAADVFGSGYQDLFVANVDQEMFSLYRNQKNETFRDVAHANEVAQATRLLSGWGLEFLHLPIDMSLYFKCCKMSIVPHMLHRVLASQSLICYLAAPRT